MDTSINEYSKILNEHTMRVHGAGTLHDVIVTTPLESKRHARAAINKRTTVQ